MIPGLRVVYTGPSILELEQGGADLSRRKIEYRLNGLSLREYINISSGLNIRVYSLPEILNGEEFVNKKVSAEAAPTQVVSFSFPLSCFPSSRYRRPPCGQS